MATRTPERTDNFLAPQFLLLNVDGKLIDLYRSLAEDKPRAFLLMFICNHCPYVKAILEKLVLEGQKLKTAGISIFAICSNDANDYPEDSFENMKRIASNYKFPFPYLHDSKQTVAKTYGAVCTPDFFGFNSRKILQYRGRLDDSGKNPPKAEKSELSEAMMEIANTGSHKGPQIPSIGCSIKWQNVTDH